MTMLSPAVQAKVNKMMSPVSGMLVVIDSGVQDYQDLAAGVVPGAQVLILDPRQDAIAQITQHIYRRSHQGLRPLTSLHLVAHGSPGALHFTSGNLDAAELRKHAAALETWFDDEPSSMRPLPQLLLYGCFTGCDAAGAAFLNQLSLLTGAIVSAATTEVGRGQWHLAPASSAPLAFTHDIQQSYAGVFRAQAMGVQSSVLNASLSDDGRYVTFDSGEGDLVVGDGNGVRDIFVLDRQTDELKRISVDSEGTESNGISIAPRVSADGQFVVFESVASNLVAADDTAIDDNGVYDIFVYSRQDATVQRVSVDSAGGQGNGDSSAPDVSADGRYVAFVSNATNLVAGDTSSTGDIFVYDREAGLTERVSVDGQGNESNGAASAPRLSADGRFVTFVSSASDLVPDDTNNADDIFVYDREANSIERIVGDAGEGNGGASAPAISADGRFVVFESDASNLVADDTNGVRDIFLYDREIVGLKRLSFGEDEEESNGASVAPSVSADGRFITFLSSASNLVAGDTNGGRDGFVYDQRSDRIERISVDAAGNQTAGMSWPPSISGDGRFIGVEGAGGDVSGNVSTVANVLFPAESLQATDNALLAVGSGATTQLQATVSQHGGGEVSEIVVIVADDALGSVDGNIPGSEGYVQAALAKAEVVLSALPGTAEFSEFAPARLLDVMGGEFLQFALIKGGSLSDFLQNGVGEVVFATAAANGDRQPGLSLTALAENQVQLAFRGPGGDRYDRLILDLMLGDVDRPEGILGAQQGAGVIDLSGFEASTVTVAMDVYREAKFDNTIGFYTLENAQGDVRDPLTGEVLSVGDAGYAAAAIANRLDLSLSGQNGKMTTYSAELKTGQLLSTFMVVQGTVDELAADLGTANAPTVYFSHLGANADGKDHVRLLGDHVFGYEDLVGGGDSDFNDVVVKLSFG